MAELKVNQVLVELGLEPETWELDVNQILAELASEGTNREFNVQQIVVEVAYTPKRRYTAQMV